MSRPSRSRRRDPFAPAPLVRRSASVIVLALAPAVLASACGGGPGASGTPEPASTSPSGSAPASAPASVLDGVYSETQAQRGRTVFREVCAECHESLEFRGERFLLSWEGTSVGRFLERLMNTMPDGAPNSLPTEQYVDVTAYILQLNGFPTGPAELDATPGALDGIVIERSGSDRP